MDWFRNKRKQVAESLPPASALILQSLPIYFRQPDIPYPYRQESNFYYLTGFTEPESFFLLKKDMSVLFIQKKDPAREVWDGYRYTTREVESLYLMDRVHTIEEWGKKAPFYLKDIKTLYAGFFDKEGHFTKQIIVKPAYKWLASFRQIKDPAEVSHVREAVSITAKAHRKVAQALKPGVSERTLHGIFISTLMENGSAREAYPGIVACGRNATVMHYKKNSSVCQKGELLLLDAGAEKNYYASDVTRIYPVDGVFLKDQRVAYEKLLTLQKALIKEVRPEVDWQTLNKKMAEGVTQILLELNVLKGSLANNISKKTYRTYLPHGLGHPLGLDVHDPAFPRDMSCLLKSGMIVTVEPGLYFPESCPVPSLRGMGLRIEDNVLVTDKGHENLSHSIPKEVDEIEAICAH